MGKPDVEEQAEEARLAAQIGEYEESKHRHPSNLPPIPVDERRRWREEYFAAIDPDYRGRGQ